MSALRERVGKMTPQEKVLIGKKPPGIKLGRLNEIISKFGFVLVIGIEVDKDKKLMYKNTRLWFERKTRR